MPGVFPAIADLDDSAAEPSTAPSTPDGSLTFSPIIQAANFQDAFDGITEVQTRSGMGSSTTLDLDATVPKVVENICCVGAGYVGEFQTKICGQPLQEYMKMRPELRPCKFLIVTITPVPGGAY